MRIAAQLKLVALAPLVSFCHGGPGLDALVSVTSHMEHVAASHKDLHPADLTTESRETQLICSCAQSIARSIADAYADGLEQHVRAVTGAAATPGAAESATIIVVPGHAHDRLLVAAAMWERLPPPPPPAAPQGLWGGLLRGAGMLQTAPLKDEELLPGLTPQTQQCQEAYQAVKQLYDKDKIARYALHLNGTDTSSTCGSFFHNAAHNITVCFSKKPSNGAIKGTVSNMGAHLICSVNVHGLAIPAAVAPLAAVSVPSKAASVGGRIHARVEPHDSVSFRLPIRDEVFHELVGLVVVPDFDSCGDADLRDQGGRHLVSPLVLAWSRSKKQVQKTFERQVRDGRKAIRRGMNQGLKRENKFTVLSTEIPVLREQNQQVQLSQATSMAGRVPAKRQFARFGRGFGLGGLHSLFKGARRFGKQARRFASFNRH